MQLLAAGCASAEPSAFAEVCVWDVASGTRLAALQYHPVAVEALSFSPDNRFLVSVGRDPERSVVVWEVGGLSVTLVSNLPAIPGQPVAVAPPVEGRVVAVGRTRFAVAAAAWLPVTGTDAQSSTDGGVLAEGGVAAYRFVTAGGDGLLLWGLRPSCLEQTPVALGACDTAGSPSQPGASQPAVAATAVTVDGSGLVVVADAGGRVWEVAVQGDGGSVAMRRVADVPGREVTRIAVSGDAAAVGTLGGLVAAYRCVRVIHMLCKYARVRACVCVRSCMGAGAGILAPPLCFLSQWIQGMVAQTLPNVTLIFRPPVLLLM